jgi:hypothetical protein
MVMIMAMSGLPTTTTPLTDNSVFSIYVFLSSSRCIAWFLLCEFLFFVIDFDLTGWDHFSVVFTFKSLALW